MTELIGDSLICHLLRLKSSMNFVVEGCVPRGRPKKTWNEVIENDLRILGLQKEVACDRKK